MRLEPRQHIDKQPQKATTTRQIERRGDEVRPPNAIRTDRLWRFFEDLAEFNQTNRNNWNATRIFRSGRIAIFDHLRHQFLADASRADRRHQEKPQRNNAGTFFLNQGKVNESN